MIKNVVWLALLAFFIFPGCKKPDSSIGLDNLPDSDLIDLLVIDTLSVELNTLKDDSLRTDQFNTGVLGRIFHPRIGETAASFAAQLRLSATDVNFGSNPVADSISLNLKFSGSSFGEHTDHQIIVRQLADSLALDTSYYSTFDPETLHGTLSNMSQPFVSIKPTKDLITETETTEAGVKVILDLDFAQTLLDLDSSVYSSNEQWLDFFPGILVSSSSGHGAAGFDISSGLSVMKLHYHNDTDTSHYEFVLGPTSARVNVFTNNYVSGLEALYSFEPEDAIIPGNDLAYIMSGGGIITNVEFPHLDSVNTVLGTSAAILKAELVLTLDECYYDARYGAPLLLGIGLRDEDGGLKAIPDKYSPLGVGGVFNKTTREYRFNLTKTVQHILNRNEDYAGYGDFPPGEDVPPIILTSLYPGTSLEGVVLKGTDVEENGAKLVLTCTH